MLDNGSPNAIALASLSSAGHAAHSVDDERRRLARELHDSVVQTLQLMLVEMEQFKSEQFDPHAVVQHVGEYQAYTRDVLNELRTMLYELRDEPTIDTDFAGALRALIAGFQLRTGIHARVSISRAWPAVPQRIPALHIRRIVEEALHNIRRHSRAGRCSVALADESPRTLLVVVSDNGVGMPWTGNGHGSGAGLTGIRERVLLLGGRLTIGSGREGGTVLSASIPRESVV